MYNMQIQYPAIESFPDFTSAFDHHAFFKEQISYLYFNLTRKNNIESTLKLGSLYRQVLDLLKKKYPTTTEYLNILYRMVGECRDIFGGKGEHDLSYCLLMNLYEVYPTLAIFALHRFVQPTNNNNIVYGSWRDMKYLCEFLSMHSTKKENHPLIEICIELINTQLAKDLHSWKFSIHAFSREHISYVSKWIPRENKKFHWLFNKLAVHWSNKHKPYLLSTTDYYSYSKALTKAKKIYRKVTSLLNKALDTTEIKQCSQQLYNIIPSHVPSFTTMKQNNMIFANSLLTKSNLFDRMKCSQLFENHFQNIFDKYNDEKCMDKTPLYFTLSHFVKEAIRLKTSSNSKEIYVLNKQWECFSKSNAFIHNENIIPMLDISFDMQSNTESFYFAIGTSLFIAQNRKNEQRILTMDNVPTWIILDPSANFINNIENILKSIKNNGNTCLNVKKSFDLLSMAFLQTDCSYGYIRSTNLIFFSIFNNTNDPTYIYNEFKNSFKVNKTHPNILFWNLNTDALINLPDDIPGI